VDRREHSANDRGHSTRTRSNISPLRLPAEGQSAELWRRAALPPPRYQSGPCSGAPTPPYCARATAAHSRGLLQSQHAAHCRARMVTMLSARRFRMSEMPTGASMRPK
jgi:hypothetical protein